MRGTCVFLFIAWFLFPPLTFAYMHMYGPSLCKEEGFHCVRIRHQSWRSLFPEVHDRDIVMRINRMNTQLYPGLLIAVPDNVEADDWLMKPAEKQEVKRILVTHGLIR